MLHHGLKIDLSWQKRNPGDYYFNNLIVMPRGYVAVNSTVLTCYAFNYKFPFLYPDFSVGPLVYFKRVKANLFYDGAKATLHGESINMQSTGVELTSDLHLLRFVFPLDLGFRMGYKIAEKEYFYNILFSVNL
jgi:hypothetical protein